MNNDIITLITTVNEPDEEGFNRSTEIRNEGIFANFSDAKRTEFYAAASANIRVSKSAVIHTEDWKHCSVYSEGVYVEPTKVEHGGKTYEIVRQYEVDEVTTVLTLKEVE